MKQGGNSNTITIVNEVRKATAHLLDISQQLKTAVVFDQSVFVKTAIKNVISEGAIGLCLTGIMILLFLGNLRATAAVLLSIPISCIATFLILKAFGDSINFMVLGGMALVLSRLIDNSVAVLENIFRHFEMGEDSVKASQEGGKEVQLAVLAATFSTAIVFFPVVLLTGVSKYLFTALALAVVIALCSYVVAMTVVPLFCSKFIKHTGHGEKHESAEKDDEVPEHMRGGHGQKNIFSKSSTTSIRLSVGCRSVTMEPFTLASGVLVLSSWASLSLWCLASRWPPFSAGHTFLAQTPASSSLVLKRRGHTDRTDRSIYRSRRGRCAGCRCAKRSQYDRL